MSERDDLDPAVLEALQRQIGQLLARRNAREERRARRARGVYDPPEPPGPKPSELAIERAERILGGR